MARLNDISIQTLTIPKKDMLMHALDQDDGLDKNIEYQNLMKFMTRTGAGVPVAAPDILGQIYIDTTNGWRYIAEGISAVSDWHLVYAYGTETITGGGGDLVVNLGGNWVNGKLEIFISQATTDYFNSSDDFQTIINTTYDALTVAGYTASENLVIFKRSNTTTNNQNNITDYNQSTNLAGLPKSATTTSFTLDDDGATTIYVKWIIHA